MADSEYMGWQATANALGGAEVLGVGASSGAAFVQRIEQGLPKKAVARFKSYSRFSDAEIAEVIPRRTLTTLKHSRRLSVEQSDRFARMAWIATLARRVFGEADDAKAWLLSPNAALGGESPLRMLRTESGAHLVASVLTRIEHGVYE